MLSLIVSSQISQTSINLEEKQDCVVSNYNTTEKVYGNVTRIRDTYSICYNSTSKDYYRCVNGTEAYQSYEAVGNKIVEKERNDCVTGSYVVNIQINSRLQKKEVDFREWGACINQTEGDCVAIICGTLKGGSARNGVFNGCDGGKACQKFLFCHDTIKVLYKDSTSDFREKEPTFRVRRLGYKESLE